MNNKQLIRKIENHLRSTPQNNASTEEIAYFLNLPEIDAAGLDVLLDASPNVKTDLRYENGKDINGNPWGGFVLDRR